MKKKKHFCWTECGSSFALVKITDHEKLLPKWMHSFAPFDVHSTQSRFALYTYYQDYVCNFKMFAVNDIGLLKIKGETWFVSCSFKFQESEWIHFFFVLVSLLFINRNNCFHFTCVSINIVPRSHVLPGLVYSYKNSQNIHIKYAFFGFSFFMYSFHGNCS